MKLDMLHEPLRLPAWLVSLLALVVIPLATDLLTGVEWRTALVAVLAAVLPLVGGVEMVRPFMDSPATRKAKAIEVRGVELDPQAVVQVNPGAVGNAAVADAVRDALKDPGGR
jgi:hypothetical protein